VNKELIQKMQSQFDALARKEPGADAVEFCFARDLQAPLGYARWENFMTAIKRALESCRTTDFDPEHHFRGVTKMVTIGSGAWAKT
jgi:DNA-damage-inducible protein D